MLDPLRTSPFAAVVVALGVLAAGAVSAQTEAPKIGLVDVQKVMSESTVARSAMQRLEGLRSEKESAIQARAAEIQDLRRRLATESATLAAEAVAEIERELERKTIDAQRLQDDANRELARQQERVVLEIEGKVMPVIDRIGREMGYTLILRKFESGLLYADESLDLTDELIARLDAGS